MPRGGAAAAPLIFVDSSVYIDLLAKNQNPHQETGEPRWRAARAVFRAIDNGLVRLAASTLVEAEVLTKPVFRSRAEPVQRSVRERFRAPSVVWSDVDRFLAQDAADLAGEYYHKVRKSSGMGAADALHLAAAVRLRCDYLMTQDTGFPIGDVVRGVRVVLPEVVWQPTLDEA